MNGNMTHHVVKMIIYATIVGIVNYGNTPICINNLINA